MPEHAESGTLHGEAQLEFQPYRRHQRQAGGGAGYAPVCRDVYDGTGEDFWEAGADQTFGRQGDGIHQRPNSRRRRRKPPAEAQHPQDAGRPEGEIL